MGQTCAMTRYEYKYIENQKWEDTAKEITQLERQGWELVSVGDGRDGAGVKPFPTWLRKPLPWND